MENTINERVKLLRNQLNLNMDEFAMRCNINRTTLWRIENNQGDAMPKTLKAVASAFGVNYTWLLNGKGKMFSDQPKQSEAASGKTSFEKALAVLEEQLRKKDEMIEWLKGLVDKTGNFLQPLNEIGQVIGEARVIPLQTEEPALRVTA